MFGTAKGHRVVDVIAEQLRTAILSGSLSPGDRLPPERTLSKRFAASRLTVRNAISQLVSEGLLSVQQGGGTWVKNPAESGTLDLLAAVIRHRLGTPQALKVFQDLLELRRWAASEVAGLACGRRSAVQLRQLEQEVAALFTLIDDPHSERAQLSEQERTISTVLVDAADNLGFRMLFHTLQRVLNALPSLREGLPDERKMLSQSYRQLLEWVRAGEAESARIGVRLAFEAVDAELLKGFARNQKKPQRS